MLRRKWVCGECGSPGESNPYSALAGGHYENDWALSVLRHSWPMARASEQTEEGVLGPVPYVQFAGCWSGPQPANCTASISSFADC